jgi:hypothetical protein
VQPKLVRFMIQPFNMRTVIAPVIEADRLLRLDNRIHCRTCLPNNGLDHPAAFKIVVSGSFRDATARPFT